MENLNTLIGSVNNIFWSYLLIIVLIGCALWFSFRTRFVQFRMLREMFRIPFEKKEHKSAISSFEAFAVSLASRVGTGNLAGVATAIVVGFTKTTHPAHSFSSTTGQKFFPGMKAFTFISRTGRTIVHSSGRINSITPDFITGCQRRAESRFSPHSSG